MGLSLTKSILGSVAAKKKRIVEEPFNKPYIWQRIFQNHIEDTQYGSKKLSYPLLKGCEDVSIANNHPQTSLASLLKTSH